MQQRAPKGAGSFKTNADGSVTYRKSVGRKTNGQRKVLTVTAATKTAAMKLMKAKEQKWEKEEHWKNCVKGIWNIRLIWKNFARSRLIAGK